MRKQAGIAEPGYQMVAVLADVPHPDDPSVPVEIQRCEADGRLKIMAFNEGGFNGTEVDLLGVIEWVIAKCPEIIGTILENRPEFIGARLLAAAKRVCDERLLLHRFATATPPTATPATIEVRIVSDPPVESAIDHGPDCVACALRTAVEGLTGRKSSS